MKRCVLILALLTWPLAAWAQKPPLPPQQPPSEPPKPVIQKPRPHARILGQIYVGQKAPDFKLDNARGRETKLSSFRGDWVLLAFADRGRDFSRLRDIDSRLARFGAKLVTVSREKVQTLRNLAEKDTLKFTQLADVTGEISASYGFYDYEVDQVQSGFLLLDRGGVVRWMVSGPLPPNDALVRLAEYAITGL